jgi:hypothetical protein
MSLSLWSGQEKASWTRIIQPEQLAGVHVRWITGNGVYHDLIP